jgi:hypothetical protein
MVAGPPTLSADRTLARVCLPPAARGAPHNSAAVSQLLDAPRAELARSILDHVPGSRPAGPPDFWSRGPWRARLLDAAQGDEEIA